MMDSSEGLEHVYGARDSVGVREAYDEWATSYDAENVGNGYRIPGLAAAFFAQHVPHSSGPFMDAGCGTGLVGEALAILGYESLVGVDLSPEMLKFAGALDVYERLYEHDLGLRLPESDDSLGAVACIGSLGPGHAPASCLKEFLRVTRPEGKIILNVRHDTFVEQGLKAEIDALTNAGLWTPVAVSPVFRPFLLAEPNVSAQIYVLSVA